MWLIFIRPGMYAFNLSNRMEHYRLTRWTPSWTGRSGGLAKAARFLTTAKCQLW